jgi:hypothetical protein
MTIGGSTPPAEYLPMGTSPAHSPSASTEHAYSGGVAAGNSPGGSGSPYAGAVPPNVASAWSDRLAKNRNRDRASAERPNDASVATATPAEAQGTVDQASSTQNRRPASHVTPPLAPLNTGNTTAPSLTIPMPGYQNPTTPVTSYSTVASSGIGRSTATGEGPSMGVTTPVQPTAQPSNAFNQRERSEREQLTHSSGSKASSSSSGANRRESLWPMREESLFSRMKEDVSVPKQQEESGAPHGRNSRHGHSNSSSGGGGGGSGIGKGGKSQDNRQSGQSSGSGNTRWADAAKSQSEEAGSSRGAGNASGTSRKGGGVTDANGDPEPEAKQGRKRNGKKKQHQDNQDGPDHASAPTSTQNDDGVGDDRRGRRGNAGRGQERGSGRSEKPSAPSSKSENSGAPPATTLPPSTDAFPTLESATK